LTVPLTVHGKRDNGEKFSAQTNSQSVNRHGALFPLEEIVLVGHTVILVNEIPLNLWSAAWFDSPGTRRQAVYRREFVSPETNFWHMQFPIQARSRFARVGPTKVSA